MKTWYNWFSSYLGPAGARFCGSALLARTVFAHTAVQTAWILRLQQRKGGVHSKHKPHNLNKSCFKWHFVFQRSNAVFCWFSNSLCRLRGPCKTHKVRNYNCVSTGEKSVKLSIWNAFIELLFCKLTAYVFSPPNNIYGLVPRFHSCIFLVRIKIVKLCFYNYTSLREGFSQFNFIKEVKMFWCSCNYLTWQILFLCL